MSHEHSLKQLRQGTFCVELPDEDGGKAAAVYTAVHARRPQNQRSSLGPALIFGKPPNIPAPTSAQREVSQTTLPKHKTAQQSICSGARALALRLSAAMCCPHRLCLSAGSVKRPPASSSPEFRAKRVCHPSCAQLPFRSRPIISAAWSSDRTHRSHSRCQSESQRRPFDSRSSACIVGKGPPFCCALGSCPDSADLPSGNRMRQGRSNSTA